MNNRIGQVLKEYRRLSGMSVREVSERLSEEYGLKIAEKTIYGWESNQAHPTADTFLIICEIYGITDISSMLEHSSTSRSIELTEDEMEIVRNYRKYTTFQPAIRYLLRMPARKYGNDPHK